MLVVVASVVVSVVGQSLLVVLVSESLATPSAVPHAHSTRHEHEEGTHACQGRDNDQQVAGRDDALRGRQLRTAHATVADDGTGRGVPLLVVVLVKGRVG